MRVSRKMRVTPFAGSVNKMGNLQIGGLIFILACAGATTPAKAGHVASVTGSHYIAGQRLVGATHKRPPI